MRSTRLRKFRRQFPAAFFMVKLLLIWYLVVFSISYLTSGTAAQFFDKKEANSAIQAGFWAEGDGGSLSFIEKGNTNIKACDPVEITAEIQNSGEGDMVSGSTYDVYYVENGNPEKHGEKLDLSEGEGDIPALKSGDSTKLKHGAQNPGVYVFLAQQPEGDTIWSKWVIINCPPGKTEAGVETETENLTEPETEKEQRPNTETEENSGKTNNKAEQENETANNEEDNETGTKEEQDETLTETETDTTEETGEES